MKVSDISFEKEPRYRDKDHVCSYCEKPGHGANHCLENPNRNKKSPSCGKTAHDTSTCWTVQKKNEEKKVNLTEENEERNQEIANEEDDSSPQAEDFALIDDEKMIHDKELLTVKRRADGEPLSKN